LITDLLGFIYPFIQNFLFSQEVYCFIFAFWERHFMVHICHK